MRPLHIAIAGCGPAGLSAALFLHRAGHRVTLFDQVPARTARFRADGPLNGTAMGAPRPRRR